MTVQELIKELKTLDPYAKVRVEEFKGYVYDFLCVEEMEATSDGEAEAFLVFTKN